MVALHSHRLHNRYEAPEAEPQLRGVEVDQNYAGPPWRCAVGVGAPRTALGSPAPPRRARS
eukprot:7863523-Pyramimonas_sp.AAC.1